MKKIIISVFIVIIIASGLWVANSKLSEQKPPIRIGSNNWPGYEFLYLAKSKGFYKEEGVDVDIVQYGSLDDVRFGYEKGQIDVVASTIIELLMLKERTNKNPQVFLLADFSNGADVLLARKAINTLVDLNGKRIGVEPQSLGVFILYRALEKAGLDFSDVDVIGIDQGNMVEAMRNNTIDATISYPPSSIEIEKDEDVHLLFDSSNIPGEIIDVVSADSAFITARKKDFNAIKRAWDRAVLYARKQPDDAYAIMGQKEGINASEFAEALEGIEVLLTKDQDQYLKENGTVDKAIQLANAILKNNGQLQKSHESSELIYRQ